MKTTVEKIQPTKNEEIFMVILEPLVNEDADSLDITNFAPAFVSKSLADKIANALKKGIPVTMNGKEA